MPTIAVYAGSFDPMTRGHEELARRSRTFVDELVIAVTTNSSKRPLFLGEYGAWEGIAVDQRATYYKAVHDAFKGANVDGCVWAYTNTFPFRDPASNTWYTQLLHAIGL